MKLAVALVDINKDNSVQVAEIKKIQLTLLSLFVFGDVPVCIKAVVAAVGLPFDAAARGAASMEHFVQVEVSRGTAAGQIGQLNIGHH